MKRLFLLFFLYVVTVANLFPAPVDTSITRRVAVNFFNSRAGTTQVRSSVTPSCVYVGKVILPNQADSVECFRIYNVGDGYVIVSTYDCFIPVLGYSMSENFPTEGGPEALYELLDDYKAEMLAALNASPVASDSLLSKWEELSAEHPLHLRSATPIVSPLLTTKWNQTPPYNSMCPSDPSGPGGHAYTGCVATAMAQVIRYWQYPEHGIGSHSYDCNFADAGYGNYGSLSADFAAATYNYDNMPNYITSSSPVVQKNAVAQLMYHCGVSLDMMYGPNASGASTSKIALALINYFGYWGCFYEARSGFSDIAWINMLKNSLDNMQPVIYHGSGQGSHAFVCDGYDSEDYFHINLGWGGYCDNYFLLSALIPNSTSDYSNNQGAVFGIDANTPMARFKVHKTFLFLEEGTIDEGHPVQVMAHALDSPITLTVTDNFQISVDSVNYSNTQTLSSGGGTLYVRFVPSESVVYEHGVLYLASDDVTDSLVLTGCVFSINCDSPKNLKISTQDLQHVTIEWDSASLEQYQQQLTWGVQNFSYCIGYNSYYQYSFMHRYCDTDLISLHGQSLVSIDFYVSSGANMYKAVVYKGGYINGTTISPGTLVYSQDIDLNSLTANSWNTVVLNTPVEIDASQELWFGIYVEASGGNYVIPLSYQSVSEKSNVYAYHFGTLSTNWELYTTNNYSFCLKGNVADRHVITNYQVFRGDTLIGTTQSLSFQDSVGSGTYLYTVVANWSNGCSSSIQRYYTNAPHILATPSALDFYTRYGFDNIDQQTKLFGNMLSEEIRATVVGNFLVSTDSIHFADTALLPPTGGNLYVRYVPDPNNDSFETGVVMLSSGDVSASILLTGQPFEACEPPENFVVSQTASRMNLTWDAPEMSLPNQHQLSWCPTCSTSSQGSYYYGVHSYLMHRYEPSDLAPYHNKMLTAISFISNTDVTLYKLVVYKGGSYDGTTYNPGTLVTEQLVDMSTLSYGYHQWNTVQLEQPILIDAHEELWYGIYLESSTGSPIYLGTPYLEHKGCIYKSLIPYASSWYEFSTAYSFSLKAVVEDLPRTFQYYLVERDADSIASTNQTDLADYPSEEGFYRYRVWSVWDDGCRASANRDFYAADVCTLPGQSPVVETCDSYWWHGKTYNESGTYFHTWLNEGCSQKDTLHLTVNYSKPSHKYISICEGDLPYVYGDSVFEVGTPDYSIHQIPFTTVHGCDSTVKLYLSVSHPHSQSTYVDATDAYIWYGSTYTSSGTYTHTHESANGCEQVDTLYLVVHPSSPSEFYATACEEYTWNDTTYSSTGDYVQHFTNMYGADSTVTMHLVVHQPQHQSTTMVVSDDYPWHDIVCSATGTYTYAFQDINGCEQVDTLHLTMCFPCTGDTTAVVCDRFDWYELHDIMESGDYMRTFTNKMGCDSVVTLHLTVKSTTYGNEYETACDSFAWNGSVYTGSGDFQMNFTNALGCDSVATLHLTILNRTLATMSETVCDHYDWNGTTYNASGDYVRTFTNAVGCDSVVTLHLTVVPPPAESPIRGASTICRYQNAEYKYDISNPNYQYKWFKNNELWQENVSTVYLNETLEGDVLLTMQVSDPDAACNADTSILVHVLPANSPAQTEIRRKENSNILVCQPVSSEYGNVHYRWGYTNRVSEKETVVPGDWNYCQFNIGIDTNAYYYWVETYIRINGEQCANRSYYGIDTPSSLQELDGTVVKAYMVDNHVVLRVNQMCADKVTAALYSVSGSQLLFREYGQTESVSDEFLVDVARGVYLLKVMVGQEIYMVKLLKM